MGVGSSIPNIIAEMGLGAGLSILIFIAFFFLLKWVLGVSSDQLKSMADERKVWAEIQKAQLLAQHNVQEQIRANMATSTASHDSITEAHRCQREEHTEMIKALARINGYKE